uniref:CRM domain-containing protein n=1 Tax=Leersia perrieri TaxID=77586 RepID=A0A0D9XLH2_9ORYZ
MTATATAAAAAAATLLRLPLARLSSHLRSLPSPPIPPPRLRIYTSHRLLSSLLASTHGPPAAASSLAEAVAAPDGEGIEAEEEEEAVSEDGEEARSPSFVLPRLPRPKLSVKERKDLASYAHGLGKRLKSQQVGKGGVTPSMVSAFNDNLESNELLKLKIHGNCPVELPDVILQLEESTGSIAVDQIGRSVILYRPSTSKMKKREQSARSSTRFLRSQVSSEEHPRSFTTKRYVKSGGTFRPQQKRKPLASKGSSYGRG